MYEPPVSGSPASKGSMGWQMSGFAPSGIFRDC